jgi:nitrous oxidase accessory protein
MFMADKLKVNKLILFILILILPLRAMSACASGYTNVSVADAKEMVDSNPSLQVLDVRNESEYDAGHLKNAKLISITELGARLSELDETHEILVYCANGEESAVASQTLTDKGFLHVYNMLGGIMAWIAAGYPVYVKYSSIQEAVDYAAEGTTIYLSAGLYYDHLTINKSVNLYGENKYTTVIDGSGNGTVINVKADNINITGLTVQESGCSCTDYSGIYVRNHHQNVNLTDNLIIQNGYGIKMIWANNITIDHNEITNNTEGIEAVFSSNTTISENNISDNFFGVDLNPASHNTIVGNNVTDSYIHNVMLNPSSNENIFSNNRVADSSYGIRVEMSFNNTFQGNRITDNIMGVQIENSTSNMFYQNSFVNNSDPVDISPDHPNLWCNGYPFEGNYWSNYAGVDLDHDGIGDSAYMIDASNKDDFPLMGIFFRLSTLQGRSINVVSNSTLQDVQYSETDSTIRIHLSNLTQEQKRGFCRLTLPHDLMLPPYNVTINNSPTSYSTIYEDATLSIIYFSYEHSALEIDIIPEFSAAVLPLLLIGTLLAFIVLRSKRQAQNTRKRSPGIWNV